MKPLDTLDVQLLQLVMSEPKAGVREYSRRLGIARATAQSRLDKMVEAGVIRSFAPHIDLAKVGFPLSAYIHLTLRQVDFDKVIARVGTIPYVTQADSMAGAEDLTCRVVARDHEHLETISLGLMRIEGVERIRTDIVLRHRIPHRLSQLIREL
ncbi:AsnC family transcriptional regulator [Corynebacterium falsenii DSM 44353]|uniref:Lrp/AsnC family transcriptional regulator n=1 Tax=Corynebacterium falsenii TaxID=108486 RepID=A0A418Q835_9CORY|nr:Lrp/AsnC family transcriptional regulator [Corynebacterium falsenii]AHI03121.1 AsnC family transcriptional regulator [Corynebacterium falsenii DSM 44353]RIX35646.1 Lrp/AsnC family transcriptional regulator [Corynebacterium falsenii]UBI03830.1 Lrp/AsnC family transcriptional regulator [Corynebacterium falsenii]UBI06159.1 Lrp/AsnC family transcriptional regulator [Corynebacterium falsenii]